MLEAFRGLRTIVLGLTCIFFYIIGFQGPRVSPHLVFNCRSGISAARGKSVPSQLSETDGDAIPSGKGSIRDLHAFSCFGFRIEYPYILGPKGGITMPLHR